MSLYKVITSILLFYSLLYLLFKYRQQKVKAIKYNVQTKIFSAYNKESIDKYLKTNSYSEKNILINSDLEEFDIKCVKASDFEYIEKYTELKLTFYEKDIISKGYYFSRHKVVTEDGYVNTLWRISKKCESEKRDKLIPIIINHGLLDNAYTFFQLDKSLPYLLADQGYDVWLSNNRGSTFSSEHLLLDSYDISSDYWDFTFIEIAKYDLKSNINFVLNYTFTDKVHFIGHSQGGFQLMVSFILDQDYFNDRIATYSAFGTVPKFIIIDKKFPIYIDEYKILNKLEYFGVRNMMSVNEENTVLSGKICEISLKLCTSIIKSIIEKEDEKTIDYVKLFNLYYYEPGGTSTKNLIHWLQTLTTHDISFFDYRNIDEYDKNDKYYGNEHPPIINMDGLRNMSFKSAFFLGEKDPYVPDLSVLYFRQICNQSEFTIIKNYNHLSYIWSETAKEEIYDKVLELIGNYH